jgi:hypothetical protein
MDTEWQTSSNPPSTQDDFNTQPPKNTSALSTIVHNSQKVERTRISPSDAWKRKCGLLSLLELIIFSHGQEWPKSQQKNLENTTPVKDGGTGLHADPQRQEDTWWLLGQIWDKLLIREAHLGGVTGMFWN